MWILLDNKKILLNNMIPGTAGYYLKVTAVFPHMPKTPNHKSVEMKTCSKEQNIIFNMNLMAVSETVGEQVLIFYNPWSHYLKLNIDYMYYIILFYRIRYLKSAQMFVFLSVITKWKSYFAVQHWCQTDCSWNLLLLRPRDGGSVWRFDSLTEPLVNSAAIKKI